MDESHEYRLQVGPLSARTTDGNSTDLGFTEHNGERFSTYDHRYLGWYYGHSYCKRFKDLKKLQGGWWFDKKTFASGCLYKISTPVNNLNAGWDGGVKLETRRQDYFLTSIEMKIRRI
ncbi:hypothetical protein ElyMa_001564300 [Elysia marginata]|uniref:Fibrinogen C-terminal domain-containing protein n=1 Tax=Elysia marginata TaxID=1093978 RepID=A0AAV4JCY8_9GAST|nr:hypothetical protein ElyMa_001564300 [Elysia marginata]